MSKSVQDLAKNADKVAEADVGSFVAALVLNVFGLAIEIGLFSYLRKRVSNIYEPRVYIPPEARRSPAIHKGFFGWFWTIIRANPSEAIDKIGLDAYFMLEFLRMLLKIFSVSAIVTFAVLVPVNIVHGDEPQDQQQQPLLQTKNYFRIAWGNIPDERSIRYTAHVCLAYILTGYVAYLLRAGLKDLARRRHEYLTNERHTNCAQSRTVLITGIPKKLLTEDALRQFASFVPGGVAHVWIYRASKDIADLFNQRLQVCQQLETATTKLLMTATKLAKKRQEKGGHSSSVMPQSYDDIVPASKRPRHRPGVFRWRVDTIGWAKEEIVRLDGIMEKARNDLSNVEAVGSAFIELNLQLGAHVLTQCVSYHEPLAMVDKWTEVAPGDVIWDNIDTGSLTTRTRFVFSWAVTIGFILTFSIPVLAIQSLANLGKLCTEFNQLSWVCEAPPVAVGLLLGVIPPLLMAIMFTFIPFFLRALSWFERMPRHTIISQRVYDRNFIFFVVHGFLVAFIAGGLADALPRMFKEQTLAQNITQLANNLPKASTYFMTYIMTTGFSGAGTAMLQVWSVIAYTFKKKWSGRTPREAHKVSRLMPSVDFGDILPPISLLATIGLSYVVINPLLNAVSMLAVAMILMAYKYLFLYVLDQPEAKETGGLYFPKVVSNMFIGLYITQGTVATLLFLRIVIPGARIVSIAQGSAMVLLLIITAIYHVYLNKTFSAIVNNLPMSLATDATMKLFDNERKKNSQDLESALPDEVDLFNRKHVESVLKHRLQRQALATEKRLSSYSSAVSIAGPSTSAMRRTVSLSAAVLPTLIETSPELPQALPFSRDSDSPEDSKSHPSRTLSTDIVTGSPEDSKLASAQPLSSDTGSPEDSEDELIKHIFIHPAQYKSAQCIWVPHDELGFSTFVVNDLRQAKVRATDEGAKLDASGVVTVESDPPVEA